MTIQDEIASRPTPETDAATDCEALWNAKQGVRNGNDPEMVVADFARPLEQQRDYLMELVERVTRELRHEAWRENNIKGVQRVTPVLNEVRAALSAIRG